jgi:hypothetical protein
MDHNRSLSEMVMEGAALNDAATVAFTEALVRDADPNLVTLSLKYARP